MNSRSPTHEVCVCNSREPRQRFIALVQWTRPIGLEASHVGGGGDRQVEIPRTRDVSLSVPDSVSRSRFRDSCINLGTRFVTVGCVILLAEWFGSVVLGLEGSIEDVFKASLERIGFILIINDETEIRYQGVIYQ